VFGHAWDNPKSGELGSLRYAASCLAPFHPLAAYHWPLLLSPFEGIWKAENWLSKWLVDGEKARNAG
jgi:hypothetical protein